MKQNNIDVVYGRKGAGKTHLLQVLSSGKRNAIWFDMLGSFAPSMMTDHEFEAMMPGWSRTDSLDGLVRDLCHPVWRERNVRAVYLSRTNHVEHELAAIHRALVARYTKTRGHFLMIVDEVDMTNRGHRADETIQTWVRRGRHWLIDQMYATRRPFELDRNISAMADHTYIFATHERRDVDYFKGKIPNEILARIMNLKTGQYYHYNHGTGAITQYLPEL